MWGELRGKTQTPFRGRGLGTLWLGKMGIVWVNPEVTRSSEVLSASTLWLYPLLAFSPELQPRVSC